MAGKIEAICISETKGVGKQPVPRARFRAGFGIVGDAHAGRWHRQVSLLSLASIDRMREAIPDLAAGAFAENIVTSGIDYRAVSVGDRLQLGSTVLLEVSQIGKECHTACAIGQAVGDCIMPREGIFCRVLAGGHLRTGDHVQWVLRVDNPHD